ncbi:hypothetical protein AB833_11205 [Chromatiales bacterium (ex Bugula neritina AB1)]|nr:hypothetical protein AB833_11205 [Chromatiales bacterium (ex Bugula neritina AB1)]
MVVAENTVRRGGRFGYITLAGFYIFFAALTFLMHMGEVTLKMDRLIHDSWVRLGQSTPPDDLIVVGIDGRSVAENGRWPWSRLDQATIVDNLTAAGAKVILIDILYSEPSLNAPVKDARLAFSIEQSGRVILPVHTEGKGAEIASGESLPIPQMASAAMNLGHVFLPIDSDGIVRRVFLKAGFNKPHWSMLSLVAMESLGEEPDFLPGLRTSRIDHAGEWVGDYEVLIPFHGPKNTFKTVSAVDVLNGNSDLSIFQGSTVFFGLTATGLGDAVPTPILGLDQPIPGVEVHANIYSALKAGNLIGQVGNWLSYLLVAVSIAVLLAIYSRLRPRWGLLATVLLALLPILLSYVLYRIVNIWFAPLLAAIPILLAFPLWSWHRLEFASRFLRTETNKLAIYDDDIGVSARLPLESMFENAANHLGLKKWLLLSDNTLRSAGDITGFLPEKVTNFDWSVKDGLWVKRYPSSTPFVVAYDFDDAGMNKRFSSFLDNASRVQRRIELPDTGGTIESFQVDADRLSKQNQHMMQLKVLSDNIFNGSPAGLIVWNAVGELMRCNDLALEMFQDIQPETRTVQEFFVSLGKDPYRIDREAFDSLMKDGRNWQINFIRESHELVIDFNVLGDEMTDRLIVASAVDLSEIRRAERLRSELIEYLSHDLRSPLISSLYLVSTEREQAAKGKDPSSLLQVEANINRTLNMIDDLLGLTRAENLVVDHLQPVFFENIVETAMDQLQPQAVQKNIVLKTQHIDEDVWLSADSSLLERAFVNVVGNAIKYSPEGSLVEIVTTLEADSWIITRVIDQGIGIPESRIGKLFERFHRDPEAQKQFKGTGLGLALVATVVRQHGGVVSASSVEGQGTTVELRLPVLEIESDSAASNA